MLPQYLCRRQCLILLIFIGSLLSLYIVVINRLFKNKNVYTSGGTNIPPNTIITDKNREILNKDYESNTAIKLAKVVNGPKSIKRSVGTLDGIGCNIRDINPFSAQIMKYMHDFGEHKCATNPDIQIGVELNKIHVTGTGIDFIRTRSVSDQEKDGFRFEEFVYLVAPKNLSPIVGKGRTGSIRNVASKRCIVPSKYNPSDPPPEIEIQFSKKCEREDAEFEFTEEGTIRHKLTNKCIAPKDGLKNPPRNTQLVISDFCDAKFDVINDGVLQLVGDGSCIHPLWGGDSPEEGQMLCLYPSCEAQKRLSYHWFIIFKGNAKELTNKRYPLDNDMNHVQVQLLNDKLVDTYALSIKAKPLPTVASTDKPNIYVLSIEECSAPHFKRKLQNTYKAMVAMGFVEYKLHAAVSPSSTVNFMTMLNGHSNSEGETEGSIFQLAKEGNYVSLFSADDPINLGMGKGLSVDHSSLPLFRALKQNFNLATHTYCVTGQPIYDITFNYLSSFVNLYPSHSKLAVILLSEISRANYNYLAYMDKHFKSLLDELSSLKNTVIFVQTLKGGETGKLGQLEQGVEEIKRPFFATYVSEDIREKYKFEQTRSTQLSTSFDTYVTLRHLVSQEKQKHDYGKSLLKKYKARNCLQAAVYPSMCPCV